MFQKELLCKVSTGNHSESCVAPCAQCGKLLFQSNCQSLAFTLTAVFEMCPNV